MSPQRRFLWLVGIVVAAYLCAAGLVVFAQAVAGRGASPVVEQWGKFCASIETQNEALRALNDSLHVNHPDRVVDASRLELYTRAILESERQTALLKAMRKDEFGKAADGSERGRTPDKSESRPATTKVAFVTNSP